MIMTETAAISPVATSPFSSHQPRKVSAAQTRTTGTKIAETRSTSRWTGALLACAFSTRAMMRARTDFSPVAVVSTRNRPSPLMEPPATGSPGVFSTGRLSPVSRLSSSALVPVSTRPSTGMRSPGRMTTMSPGATDEIGTSTSPAPRSTRARSGRSAISARMAEVVERFARVSSHLPSRTRAMTMAAASK